MHCQEPWYVGVQNDQTYIVAGEPPAQGNDYPNHQADRTVIAKVYLNDRSAQRIAACVNACRGIPTGRLKKIAAHGSIIDSEIRVEAAAEGVDTKPPEARAKVFGAIGTERHYQETKWGDLVDHPQSVGAYLTLMRVHLTRAENAWAGANHDFDALDCLRKVLAIGVACGEQHGMPSRLNPGPTPIVEPQINLDGYREAGSAFVDDEPD